MSKIFLDTETTGLDPFIHDIWEVAWAVDDAGIESYVVPHSIRTADPKALELNGYWTRGFTADVALTADVWLREILEGSTIVGANPAFDAAFLQHRWRAQPWHYRLLDVSSMAVQVFGLRGDGLPPGLVDVANECRRFGEVPEPDHTAAGDVATLRACYRILESLRFVNYPQRWVSGLAVPGQLEFFDGPPCTCPEIDPLKRAAAYTVASLNLEPHAAGCPRWGLAKGTV